MAVGENSVWFGSLKGSITWSFHTQLPAELVALPERSWRPWKLTSTKGDSVWGSVALAAAPAPNWARRRPPRSLPPKSSSPSSSSSSSPASSSGRRRLRRGLPAPVSPDAPEACARCGRFVALMTVTDSEMVLGCDTAVAALRGTGPKRRTGRKMARFSVKRNSGSMMSRTTSSVWMVWYLRAILARLVARVLMPSTNSWMRRSRSWSLALVVSRCPTPERPNMRMSGSRRMSAASSRSYALSVSSCANASSASMSLSSGASMNGRPCAGCFAASVISKVDIFTSRCDKRLLYPGPISQREVRNLALLSTAGVGRSSTSSAVSRRK
mmetsp:Transcript_17849/g.46465  ORF Transcript_17849/g.46465 Transcript_17849/m.46465 type:complete len:326 (+) Transcript_17849:1852-2829(+)